MIDQPVIMDAELGRLISGLRPDSVKMTIKEKNDYFRQILGILGLEGRVEKDRFPNIRFDVAAEYMFQGLKNLPTGGWVAVFYPKFWICPLENSSDSGWSEEVFDNPFDRFYRELNKILKTAITVEIDIPDIEEVSLVWIDVRTGVLSERGIYWRIIG